MRGRRALCAVALLACLGSAAVVRCWADAGEDDARSAAAAAGPGTRASSRHSRHAPEQHHTQITVTGVDVGTAPTSAQQQQQGGGGADARDADAAAAAAAPTPPPPEAPNLLGDLISAASGESNGTIAQVLDKALAKEFEAESKSAESGKGRTFNETVSHEEAKTETVVRISASGKKKEEREEPSAAAISSGGTGSATPGSTGPSGSTAAGTASPALGGAAAKGATGGRGANATTSSSSGKGGGDKGTSEEAPSIEKGVDRIIDSQDNEFVLSAPQKDSVATLTLDPLLIQDLTCLFASAAVMGMVFEGLKQPVINGYLVAGAVVGPGGLQLIKELVQVESLAQLGVQLLLFHLGRELSLSKLKAVWSVALVGGTLQIVALSALGGIVAAFVESPIAQGIFVGALLSMSSTSVVVKCLESYRMNGTAFGQITIGTLILQDCSVGIMFALMPALGAAAASNAAGAAAAAAAAAAGGHSALFGALLLLASVLAKLVLLVAAAAAVANLVLPVMLRLLLRYASNELVQLSLMSMCLCAAWLCGRLGLSEELGAFIAGAMMSVAETRLVAAGHMLPSSAPHTPGSKGHMSAPETPCDTASTPTKIGVATAPHKHNSAAAAYYRHATQRQQQQTQQQLQRSTSGFSGEAGGEEGDALIAVQDLDPAGLTAQLQALHQQQHQALLAGGGGVPDAPLNRGSSSSSSAAAPGRSVLVTSVGSDQGGGAHGGGASVCASIESIQNVLTALFVASMGLIMSPVFLWHHAGVLLCGTLLVTLLKAGVVTGVVRMFGVPLRLSLAVGLSMAHIGEFSFVLLSMANQLKLLSTQVYMLLLGVTAMSLLTTPLVFLASVKLLGKESGERQVYITGPRLRLSCDRE